MQRGEAASGDIAGSLATVCKPTTAPQIEISIYKDGFTTSRFVKAAVADPKAVPEFGVTMLAAEGPMAAAKLPEALSLRVEFLQSVKEGAEIEVILGGLYSGP